MALSDCEKCWDTPCICGWNYRFYTEVSVAEMIYGLLHYKTPEQRDRIMMEVWGKLGNNNPGD